ncbi:hypothetical protein CUPL110328_13690 [Cupriavidus plantarum]|nr:hypothetical protein LMG26296_03674 [Cupriavidus plantarum]SMR86041.1 hypothetical protein SAMN05421735_4862 [Cupriavidus plantarum]
MEMFLRGIPPNLCHQLRSSLLQRQDFNRTRTVTALFERNHMCNRSQCIRGHLPSFWQFYDLSVLPRQYVPDARQRRQRMFEMFAHGS